MGYHTKSVQAIFDEFSSSSVGLSDTKVAQSRREYGNNCLSEKKQTPLWLQFLSQFTDFFSILLLAGAGLSFIGHIITPNQGNDIIGYALIGVTLLNASFSFFQNYRAMVVMNGFKNLLPAKILTRRNDLLSEIPAYDLVPGDIIHVREGDKIPADARLIEQNMLKVDHSMLTGESEPQLRSLNATSEKELLSRNMIFSGTLVQSGTGVAIVVRTGDATEMGKVAKLTSSVEKKQSEISKELSTFVKIISRIAIILGVLFFIFGLFIGKTFWANLVFAIGIIVANVPEGLLPTVTLTLSLAGKRMAGHNAWVKDIESIETLGSITTICTDKTGTLTQNKLKLVSLHLDGKDYSLDKDTFHASPKDYLHYSENSYFDRMLSCMYLCNNAIGDSGDPTEIALQKMVLTQKNISSYDLAKREHEIPFDSERRYMITAHQTPHHRIAYMKGAADTVLRKCTRQVSHGQVTDIFERENLLQHNQALASKGYRVLALAYKKLYDEPVCDASLENDDYIFLGLVALQDPPRVEVANAVQQCYDAGIRIIVLSGDQKQTVKAISDQVGISANNARFLEGHELSAMSDAELRDYVGQGKDPIICSRTLPADKLRVVQALQLCGEIVAVTGDGVNDAPALQQANVGVAMGLGGTDVAKEAANMVLLDDNFATIVHAIKGGRTVYENIKKFITYILTSNIPEIIPFLVFVLFGWPLALPVLLILAIDLGTDMIPAIALGKEASEGDIMKRPPRDRKIPLLTKSMLLRSYGFIGILQAVAGFIFFFLTLFSQGWSWGTQPSPEAYAMAIGAYFATVVIAQIGNLISMRTLRKSAFKAPLQGNNMLILGIVVEIVLLTAVLYVPSVQNLFGTAPFDIFYVPFMVLTAIIILVLEEIRKSISRRTGYLVVN